jgi:glycosyltransferase involved in cell wall biosynthesis
MERNNECIVAVPENKETAAEYMDERILYTPLDYKETLHPDFKFSDGKGPDIIHAWTPREIVRKHCGLLMEKFPASKLIVHLEDNEEIVAEKLLGLPKAIIESLPDEKLQAITPDTLSHYTYYKHFLRGAHGITIIVDALREFVPENKPCMILWPIIDTERYSPQDGNANVREGLGIRPHEYIVCYIGSAHSVNAHEVRSLYVAVALANREGLPVRLIRAGRDECNLLGEQDEWARKYSIELGFIERKDIPSYLALADILIQPGKADRFSKYRFPSKIPEFLSMGKPVAVPDANIGRLLKHKEEAFIMKQGDALGILDAIRELKTNNGLKERLSIGGRQFALTNFDKKTITDTLEDFYKDIIEKG